MKQKIILLVLSMLSVALFSGCKKEANETFILDEDTSLGYNIYRNHKYGYDFSYPIFLEPKRGGDVESRTFVSKDSRIKAVTSARFNHSGRDMNSLYNEEKYFLKRDGCRITYEYAKNGKVVLTGFTPYNKIFYTKIVVRDMYSYTYRDLRSVIARVDVEFENSDRYRGEEITELLKKFPLD